MQTSALPTSLTNAISTTVFQTALYRALVKTFKSLTLLAKWDFIAMAGSILFRVKAKIGKRESNRDRKALSLPATDAVLNTHELLEGILDHLDPHSLRMAQLICPAWNEMISRSSRRLAATRVVGLEKYVRELRIAFVGAKHSGRTGLFLNWTWNTFAPDVFDPTLECPGYRKVVNVDKDTYVVELTDVTSPISQGNPIPPPSLSPSILWEPIQLEFLAHTDAYVLVYSVTDRMAFDRLRHLAENLKGVVAEQQTLSQQAKQLYQVIMNVLQHEQHQVETPTTNIHCSARKPAKQRPLALIATKCDLESLVSGDWEVTHEEGAALAAELGCPFYETSARSGEGVDECFNGVIREYKEERLRISREENERRLRLGDGRGEDEGCEMDEKVGRRERRHSVWDRRKFRLVARKFRGEKVGGNFD